MAQETIEHGVNLEQYGAFVENMTEKPEEAMLGLGARGVAEGRAMHTLAKLDAYRYGGEDIRRETREFTFQLGAHKEVEADAGFVDPADRPEPVEVALAGLTGCINATVGIVAMENDIDLDGLETTVGLDLDPRVLFGVHGTERSDETYDNFEIDIDVSGPDLTEADAETLREGVRRSPVFNLMSLPHEMSPEVRTRDEPKAA
ncbi:OsmC family protein [Halorussus aquaticus]|uniref:OsmC family protein n=1 Tax=Halorussus aquaticus TaxID=2953748 RepID=A0ABD5Q300_9EURY|nr:OsmC family protein [Halorussus aquaticus]